MIEKIISGVEAGGYRPMPNWATNNYVAPTDAEIDDLIEGLVAFRGAKQRAAKVIVALDRAIAGTKLIKKIKSHEVAMVDSAEMSAIFGGEWEKIKEKIIKNSFSPALHFLPRDTQDPVFSGIRYHSLALFRYPATVPLKVLDHAQEATDGQWAERVQSLNLSAALREAFLPARPIKLLSLRAAFLADILTRFSALYNRIGSPDFTPETVDSYAAEVDN